MSEFKKNRINRLKFRSWHRGTREMDLLLGSFADQNLLNFSQSQLDFYEEILDINDPDLYDWIAGKKTVLDIKINEVLLMLKNHQLKSVG